MINKMLFALLIFILLNNACRNNNSKEENRDQFEVRQIFQYEIPLSNVNIQSIQYFEHNNTRYLSLLDEIQATIYIFDYESKELFRKVDLRTCCPKEIGDYSILTHKIIGFDTILITNFSRPPKLFSIDFSGNKVFEKEINPLMNGEIITYPYADNAYPIQMIQNNILIPLRPYDYNIGVKEHDFSSYPSYLEISGEGTYRYIYNLPVKYSQSFWGDIFFKYHASIVSKFENKNETIVSYSIDPTIYKYVENNLVLKKPISSIYIEEPVPYHKNLKKFHRLLLQIDKGIARKINEESYKEWALTNSDYGSLIFDISTGLFLRTVYLRPSVKKYRAGQKVPQYSFIIFNDQLEVLGESLIQSGLCGELYFVNEVGIHFLNPTENKTTFTVYKLKTIE